MGDKSPKSTKKKAGQKVSTRYGLEYSPHYAKESRARMPSE